MHGMLGAAGYAEQPSGAHASHTGTSTGAQQSPLTAAVMFLVLGAAAGAGMVMLLLVSISCWRPSGWYASAGCRQFAEGSPALYSTAVTATQYTMRPTSSTNGSSGHSRTEGMVATAWLATCRKRSSGTEGCRIAT